MSFFSKFFGNKEDHGSCPVEAPVASKGYHSCVDSCERDIDNLETECEKLRTDNLNLMGRVSSLTALKGDLEKANAEVDSQRELIAEKNERIEELEQRLKEADQRADGTPVKYASARKALTKAKLASLRKAIESTPAGAQGFGGSCSVYDKKTKRVSLVEFKSKEEALEILNRAEKGHVDIIM